MAAHAVLMVAVAASGTAAQQEAAPAAEAVLLQGHYAAGEVVARDIRTIKTLKLSMRFPGLREPRAVEVHTKQIEVTRDTILAAEPGRKTRLRRFYADKRHQFDDPISGLRRRQQSTLHQAQLLIEALGGGWNQCRATVERGEPSRDELATAILDNYEEALLPGRAVRPGESWDKGLDALAIVWGGEFREMQAGTGHVIFDGLIDHEGARHARLIVQVDVQGVDIDYDVRVRLHHEGSVYFHLDQRRLTYVDLPGTVALDGSIQGIPTTGEGTIRVTMRPAADVPPAGDQ